MGSAGTMTAIVQLSVESVGVLGVIMTVNIYERQLHSSCGGFIDRRTVAAVVTRHVTMKRKRHPLSKDIPEYSELTK